MPMSYDGEPGLATCIDGILQVRGTDCCASSTSRTGVSERSAALVKSSPRDGVRGGWGCVLKCVQTRNTGKSKNMPYREADSEKRDRRPARALREERGSPATG